MPAGKPVAAETGAAGDRDAHASSSLFDPMIAANPAREGASCRRSRDRFAHRRAWLRRRRAHADGAHDVAARRRRRDAAGHDDRNACPLRGGRGASCDRANLTSPEGTTAPSCWLPSVWNSLLVGTADTRSWSRSTGRPARGRSSGVCRARHNHGAPPISDCRTRPRSRRRPAES